MKYSKLIALVGFISAMTLNQTYGKHALIEVSARYQEAETGLFINQNPFVVVPHGLGDEITATDSKMEKTLFVIEMGNVIKDNLKKYEQVCKNHPHPRPHPIPSPIKPFDPTQPITIKPIEPINPEVTACRSDRIKVAKKLESDLSQLEARAKRNDLMADAQILKTFDIIKKLATNMKEAKPVHIGRPFEKLGGGIRLATAVGGGLGVTTGGAKDFGFIKKQITDGRVPNSESLLMEGFMGEFDLRLSEIQCDELVCFNPQVAVTDEGKKMFVQIGMTSMVTAENFKRKPLNLSLVLDISGSMRGNRLESAKKALIMSVEKLNADDMVSVVTFDTESEILITPVAATEIEKARIIKKVNALKVKGSTNLEAGLRDGYELISENLSNTKDIENRIILISDAGANTGSTSEDDLLKLVTDYANEGIGLTAIGLGLNFKQELINGISRSKGGNYIFSQTYEALGKFFTEFDFLVTPIAYNFKAKLRLQGIDAKLAKAYGVPAKKGEPVRELIDVQTLFFGAGGALVLEYDLNN